MNIKVQCCGFVIDLIVMLLYHRQKKIHLLTEKAFVVMAYVTMFSTVMDVVSVIAILNADSLPSFFVMLICKVYLVTLVAIVLCGLIYVCEDVFSRWSKQWKLVKICTAVAGLCSLAILILPLKIYGDEFGNVYSYGIGASLTYVAAIAGIATVIWLLMTQRKKINPRRWEAVLIWVGGWILAALIQFILPKLLLVSFAGCVGVLIIYVKLENPETNLDRDNGLFNQNALRLFLRERFSMKKDFSALSVVTKEFKKADGSREFNEDDIRYEIAVYLGSIEGAKVFMRSEEEYVLIFENEKVAEYYIPKITQRFEDGWGEDCSVSCRVKMVYMPKSDIVEKRREAYELLDYAHRTINNMVNCKFMKVDSDTVAKVKEERSIKKMIEHAIEQDRVEVYYQPIYSTKKQRFTSAEALVRIRDEEGNIIPPGRFIDVAERNGMILQLGRIVFEKVCKFIKEHPIAEYGLEYIEVNLSVVQCGYARLAENYCKIMEQYGINPGMINLEITESASLNDKDTLLANMATLREEGVKFSLDDFGTGQSNLNYIVDMPVDIVKFDREMTNAYFENGKAKYVMDAAMHMIHGMNLEIVSEGVEQKEQYDTMEELGISYIQGYYFSKPVPKDEFVEFIMRENKVA